MRLNTVPLGEIKLDFAANLFSWDDFPLQGWRRDSGSPDPRLASALDINNAVVSQLDPKELLRFISASLHGIIHHDAAFIMLYDATKTRLRVQAFDLQVADEGPFDETLKTLSKAF